MSLFITLEADMLFLLKDHPLIFDPSFLTKKITMHQGNQIPEYTKEKPGPGKRSSEQEELIAPLHVQERCP